VKIHIAIAGLPDVLVFSVKPDTANPMDTYRACLNYMDWSQLAAVETFEGEPFIDWNSVRAVWFTDDTADVAPDAEEWTTITEDESTWPPERVRVHLFDGKTGYEYTPSFWRPRDRVDMQALLGDRWRLAREGE